MVASTDRPFAPPDGAAPSNGAHAPPRARREWEAVSGLASSAWHVARLQCRIWYTQSKITVLRLGILAAACLICAFLALLGAIFFYVGCFRLLTDVLHLKAAWACLIFAGVHVVAIAIIAGIAWLLVRRRKSP